jgi:hypothetical protein
MCRYNATTRLMYEFSCPEMSQLPSAILVTPRYVQMPRERSLKEYEARRPPGLRSVKASQRTGVTFSVSMTKRAVLLSRTRGQVGSRNGYSRSRGGSADAENPDVKR